MSIFRLSNVTQCGRHLKSYICSECTYASKKISEVLIGVVIPASNIEIMHSKIIPCKTHSEGYICPDCTVASKKLSEVFIPLRSPPATSSSATVSGDIKDVNAATSEKKDASLSQSENVESSSSSLPSCSSFLHYCPAIRNPGDDDIVRQETGLPRPISVEASAIAPAPAISSPIPPAVVASQLPPVTFSYICRISFITLMVFCMFIFGVQVVKIGGHGLSIVSSHAAAFAAPAIISYLDPDATRCDSSTAPLHLRISELTDSLNTALVHFWSLFFITIVGLLIITLVILYNISFLKRTFSAIHDKMVAYSEAGSLNMVALRRLVESGILKKRIRAKEFVDWMLKEDYYTNATKCLAYFTEVVSGNARIPDSLFESVDIPATSNMEELIWDALNGPCAALVIHLAIQQILLDGIQQVSISEEDNSSKVTISPVQ